MTTIMTVADFTEIAPIVRDEAGPELSYPDPVVPEEFVRTWDTICSQGHSLSLISRNKGRVNGWILGLDSRDFFSGRQVAIIQFWYTRQPRSIGSGLTAIELLERFYDVAQMRGCSRVFGGEWSDGPSLQRILTRQGFKPMEKLYYRDL